MYFIFAIYSLCGIITKQFCKIKYILLKIEYLFNKNNPLACTDEWNGEQFILSNLKQFSSLFFKEKKGRITNF